MPRGIPLVEPLSRLPESARPQKPRIKFDPGVIDMETGAPQKVQVLLNLTDDREAQLATLRKFFPAASVINDQLIFVNPETNRLTVANPERFQAADIAQAVRPTLMGVGGGLGAVAGAPAGPITAAAGGGLGFAGGAEVADIAFRALGGVDPRTTPEQLTEAGINVAVGTGAETGGQLLGAGLRGAVRGTVRGGVRGRELAQAAVRKFGRFGETPTVGQATQGRIFDVMEGVLARFPGSAGKFANKVQATVDASREFINNRASQLAGGRRLEPVVAGREVKKGITNFATRFNDTASGLFGKIDEFIPSKNVVSVNNTIDALTELTAPIEGAPSLSGILANPKVAAIADAFVGDATAASGLPYGVLKQFRSLIGRRLAAPSLVSDIPTSELKRVYSALTADMKAAAEAAGPEASRAFERANKFYNAGLGRIENTLQTLSKKLPEDIFVALERSGKEGATKLNAVKRSLTEDEWDIVSATVLKRMGRATPGLQDELGEAFSLTRFLTNWNRLSGDARDSFFRGSIRKELDDVAGAAAIFRENTRAFADPSGTAGATTGLGLALGGGATAITGNPAFILGFAGMAGLANRGAALMTSPRFVKWLARSTEVAPGDVATHFSRLAAIAAVETPEVREDIFELLGIISSTGLMVEEKGNPDNRR